MSSTHAKERGEVTKTSSAGIDKSVGAVDKLNSRSKSISADACVECQISSTGESQHSDNEAGSKINSSKKPINTEFETNCPEERLYFQTEFEKMLEGKPILGAQDEILVPKLEQNLEKKTEANPNPMSTADQFPIRCITFIMDQFDRYAQGVHKRAKAKAEKKEIESATDRFMYADCSNKQSGRPVRSEFSPCRSKEYVNVVYQNFNDLFDCLKIPKKEFLPKIFSESGFHMNMLGPGWDTGIGQLTKAVLDNSNKRNFDIVKSQVLSSKDISCLNIRNQVSGFNISEIDPNDSLKNRCEVILPPANPLLNIFYIAVKMNQDQDVINAKFDSTDFQKLLREVTGFDKDAQKKELEEWTKNLKNLALFQGFNSGAKTAAILIEIYLKEKRAAKIQVKKNDFDFNVDPDEFKPKERSSKRTSQMTYLEFNFYHYPKALSGQNNYLVNIMSKRKILNSMMGDGVCAPKSFLPF